MSQERLQTRWSPVRGDINVPTFKEANGTNGSPKGMLINTLSVIRNKSHLSSLSKRLDLQHLHSLNMSMQQLWQPPMSNLTLYVMGHGTAVFRWDGITRTRWTILPKTTKEHTKYRNNLKGIAHQVMKESDHLPEIWEINEVRPTVAGLLHFCESCQAMAQRRESRKSPAASLSQGDRAESLEGGWSPQDRAPGRQLHGESEEGPTGSSAEQMCAWRETIWVQGKNHLKGLDVPVLSFHAGLGIVPSPTSQTGSPRDPWNHWT